MKYIVLSFLFSLINCKEKEISDITQIIYISDKIPYNIIDNYFVLDERYREPGKHSLMMTKNEIDLIKKVIIDKKIYKMSDSLKFVKSCEEKGCLSELIIKYKSGKRQHFVFDNSNYKDSFTNRSYTKINYLEEKIGTIYRSKKIEPEAVNVFF